MIQKKTQLFYVYSDKQNHYIVPVVKINSKFFTPTYEKQDNKYTQTGNCKLTEETQDQALKAIICEEEKKLQL